ncbi:MAG: hypothetical protein EBT08_18985, partial [Betaproteobacteria bacterium]|nr:hypothetical protein [Betaproteobacteria bacterium]
MFKKTSGYQTAVARRRLLQAGAAGTALASAPFAINIVRAQSAPIKIGFPTPLTGAFSAEAQDQVRAAELAVKEFNDGGGFNGRKVELLVRDDKLNPGEAASRTLELIEKDKVDFIVGSLSAATQLSINAVTRERKVIFNSISQSDAINEAKDWSPYTFHEALNPHMTAGAVARYAFPKYGKKVVYLTADYAYGHEMVRGFERAGKALGAVTLAETQRIAEEARKEIAGIQHIVSIFSSIGGGSSGDAFAPGAAAEARRAVLTISAVHRNDRKESMQDIDAQIRKRMAEIPGARFNVGSPETGGKLQLVLKSEDPQALMQAAQLVERDLRSLKGIGNINSSASLVRPEIIVRPDNARAADLGVTAASIGETVRVATAGDYDTALSKLNLAQRQVPIRVKLPDAVRADLDSIGRLTVPGKHG